MEQAKTIYVVAAARLFLIAIAAFIIGAVIRAPALLVFVVPLLIVVGIVFAVRRRSWPRLSPAVRFELPSLEKFELDYELRHLEKKIGLPELLKVRFPDVLAPSDQPDAVSEALRQLPEGFVAVDSPKTMLLEETKTVTVSIGSGDLSDFVKRLGPAVDQRKIDTTKVAAIMRVELSGDGFAITPLGQAARLVGNFAQWEFNITAKKSGKQTLSVLIAVDLQLEGVPTPTPRYEPIKKVDIEVRVRRLPTILRYIWMCVSAAVVGVAGYLAHLGPVEKLAIELYNHLIGNRIGLPIPTDTKS